MRPVHVFLILVFLGLIGLGIWFWLNQRSAPVETDIAMEPHQPVVEEPVIEAIEEPVIAPEPTPHLAGGQREPTFELDGDDCRWLTRHIPDADVAYKPGVDIHGNPVVPADLNGSWGLELPKTVTASVSRRLLKHPNLRQETPFAEIEIDLQTGAIRINGQGLLSDDQQRLIAYCRDRS